MIRTILYVLAATGLSQLSLAADPSEQRSAREIQIEYRNKAMMCARARDTDCSNACTEATKLARNGESPQFEQASKRCDEGVAPMEEKQRLAAEGRLLTDGFQWMPDVEATVIRARNNPFMVEGRSEDWNKYCKGKLSYSAAALGADYNNMLKSPGTQVILKHVQYTTEPRRSGQCIVGDIEMLP